LDKGRAAKDKFLQKTGIFGFLKGVRYIVISISWFSKNKILKKSIFSAFIVIKILFSC